MSKKTPSEGKIFNLKPEMTLAMKLAASFAITYYGLLLIFEIVTVVFRRYYFDTYYFNQGEMDLGSWEFVVQVIQLALSITLVWSLIRIFRKKAFGKAIFVSASILLIVFQFIVTGLVPWLKYALEALMVLIIAPIRVKKKIRIKGGKIEVEEVKEKEETPQVEKEPDA
jgi:magnesium-transporting ATPase (P-type)